MADTTLTLTEATKERLLNYRHDDHDSWSDVLEGMMHMLPSISDVQDGCAHCQKAPWSDIPSEDLDGFIQWFHHEFEGRDLYNANYYCSMECVEASVEQVRKYVPESPDLVRVGGRSEVVTEFEGASFYMDGDSTEIGIPLPGAFSGRDIRGEEYCYYGEPVYVKNEGDWIQSGIIEDIYHEDAHTALLLAHDYPVEMRYHPDESRRAEYEESQAEEETN